MKALYQEVNDTMTFKKMTTKKYEPENLSELIELVRDCYERGEGIYIVSKGYNWGLGSSTPPSEESSVVNLQKLDKVIDLDLSAGTICLEPGVTQGMVSELLKDTDYKIDVTGSSKETSIIGNALERGISYKGLRVESICGLEVLLPNGELLKTGSLRFNNWKVKNIYPYGVGPDLTSVFVQSSFGIVTKMTYKLTKRKKFESSIKINFHSEKTLFKSIESFNELIEDGVIEDIFHIANSNRAINAITPEILSNEGVDKSRVEKFLKKIMKTEWTSSGYISANDLETLRYKKRRIKRAFRKYAKVEFVSEKRIRFIKKLLRLFKMKNLFAIVNTIEPLLNLYKGISTDIALGAVLDPSEYNKEDNLSKKVDSSQRGFSYCLPLTKCDASNTEEMMSIIEEVCVKYSFDPSITLNPIKLNIIEAVVSIDYPRERASQARECIREMQIELNLAGHYSYRTNIYDMDLYFKDETYNNLLRSLKDAIDPKSILSLGRYFPEA